MSQTVWEWAFLVQAFLGWTVSHSSLRQAVHGWEGLLSSARGTLSVYAKNFFFLSRK